MSSISDAHIAVLLNNATLVLNRYLGIFIFFFGTIGNILNILVFSQKTLRSNPCAWLFLMSSIASIITFCSGLTSRILEGWNLDYTEIIRGLCKLRGLIVYSSLTATSWLIALATIDRWLSSSSITLRRRKSTLKTAQCGTIITICLSIGVYIHMLICYEINPNSTPTKCYSKSSECRILSDLSIALITVLCPLLIMTIFGLMIIAQIHHIHHRVHQMDIKITNNHGNKSNGSQHRPKKTDRQLLIMLFFQVTFLTVLSLPLSIHRFYLTFTDYNSKSILHIAIDNFIYNLVILLIYISNGTTFYIYTLSGGSIFRKGLLNIVQMLRRFILY